MAEPAVDEGDAGAFRSRAGVQLSIALGATVGGWLYDGSGYRATLGYSAAALVLGAILVYWTERAETAGSGPTAT